MNIVWRSVKDPHHFNSGPDPDPNPAFHFDADPDPTTHFSPDLDPLMLKTDPLRLPSFHF
jgi:hypothetical protein